MDRSARPASRGLRLTLAVAVLAWCLAAQPRPAAGQEMQMSKSPLKGTGGGAAAAADTAAAGGGAATNDTAASQRFETYQHYFALCAVSPRRAPPAAACVLWPVPTVGGQRWVGSPALEAAVQHGAAEFTSTV